MQGPTIIAASNRRARSATIACAAALLSAGFGVIDPVSAQAEPPALLCSVKVTIKSGDDDLRRDANFRLYLRLRDDPSEPGQQRSSVLLVLSTGTFDVPGDIPRQQKRVYWMRVPGRSNTDCVKPPLIDSVEIHMTGGYASWPRAVDQWDLAQVTIEDSMTLWPYVLQLGMNKPESPRESLPLAKFTETQRVWVSYGTIETGGKWRPGAVNCVTPGAC